MDARKSWNVVKTTGSPWDWENHKKTRGHIRKPLEVLIANRGGDTTKKLTVPEATRIQRILQKDPIPADGSFMTSTGEFTDSSREEIDVMLGKHFPTP